MNKKILQQSLISTAILAGLAAQSAVAEETSQKKQFEVIEVTAQKRLQSINDVPMAISAMNTEELDELGIEDTTDLAIAVPGFSFSDTAYGIPVYTIRGVGFNEYSTQATSTVGVYVDEIAIPFPALTKATNLDLERVEILKGPQGTLYGRNATAGAINYIAAKPQDTFEAGLKGSFGSYETLSAEGFVTGALSDNVNGRLALKMVNSGKGFQESISRDETLGRQDKLSLRGSLSFELGNSTNMLLSASYAKDDSESPAPQIFGYEPGVAGDLPFAVSIYKDYLDADINPQNLTGLSNDPNKADWTAGKTPKVDYETTLMSLNIDHDINDSWTFTSLTGYSKFTDDGSEFERSGFRGETIDNIKNQPLQGVLEGVIEGLTGGLLSIGYEGYLRGKNLDAADSDYVTMDYGRQYGEIDSISQEFRLTNVTDDMVLITGLYYSDSEVDNQTYTDYGISSNVNILPLPGYGFSELVVDSNQKSSTIAAYLNVDWLLSADLTLTTALRYSDDKAEYVGCTRDLDGGLASTFTAFFFGGQDPGMIPGDGYTPGGCSTVLEFGTENQGVGAVEDVLEEDSLSWRLAANYNVNNDVSVYASYSRGFKAGSFPATPALNDRQLLPVVQEQLDAYEVGFKSVLADKTLRLNGSAFYYDYKDKQLYTKKIIPIFRTAGTLGNVPESEVKGLELDAQWQATNGLIISAAVGWLDTEITEGEGFNHLGENIDLVGTPLPFASEMQANLTAKYEWELSGDLMTFVATDISYSSEANTDFKSNSDTTLALEDFVGKPYEVVIPSQPYEFDERFVNPSYNLVNLRAGVTSENWKVYVWGRNITDEYYTSNVVKNTEVLVKFPGMGATYGISLEYNWY
ncbi:MAG: TonB-dependent receptor [Gammaproteobacteria bacterium]|nr:TonB-dependent receptor [Gammaproteobacteria bacterium]